MTKLKQAFRCLRHEGIIAESNLACCQGCGMATIKIMVDDMMAKGQRPKGWCFYHAQDKERKVAGHDFYLAFGSITKKKEGDGGKARKIAAQIISTLAAFGIKTEWNGRSDTRILVKANTLE